MTTPTEAKPMTIPVWTDRLLAIMENGTYPRFEEMKEFLSALKSPDTAALTEEERINVVLRAFDEMHEAAAEASTAYNVEKFACEVVSRLTSAKPAMGASTPGEER
jgi:hypothetical protein